MRLFQSCLLIILYCFLTFHFWISFILNVQNNTSVLKKKGNPDICTCEKLLGLAGGNTKKHGNKKSAESRTPIRYNVMNMYS